MGGSSGDYLTVRDTEELTEEAQRAIEQSRLDTDINALLQRHLLAINDRDVEQVRERLQDIEDALGDRVDEMDRLLFGGSVAKHTYVDGFSDIDALVLLDKVSRFSYPPGEVREQLARVLRQSLRQGEIQEIRVGNVAVTVEYRDGAEIQLVPAIKQGEEVAISSWDGTAWSVANPGRFSRELTRVNQSQGQSVVPAIKLTKAICANRFGEAGPSGHLVEALAVEAFREYSAQRSPKAMVTHLVDYASQRVLRPTSDITGQSRNIDQALGDNNSPARQELSRRLTRLARTMESARSMADWRAMLE
ncbi:MAG: CBASS oligonucleotide cyclase [Chloroflexota bacterium]|nr:CBASS oligonucleotide cyclase [Chloroflexota bacterium]